MAVNQDHEWVGPEKVHGIVKMVHTEKGFGFLAPVEDIEIEEGVTLVKDEDIFFTTRELLGDPFDFQNRCKVTFRLYKDPRAKEDAAVNKQFHAGAIRYNDKTLRRSTGVTVDAIVDFCKDGKYAWLKPLQDLSRFPGSNLNNGHVFCSAREAVAHGVLEKGATVTFDLYSDQRGLGAANVRFYEPPYNPERTPRTDFGAPSRGFGAPAGGLGPVYDRRPMVMEPPRFPVHVKNVDTNRDWIEVEEKTEFAGTMKFFHRGKGYGFIIPTESIVVGEETIDSEKGLFVHDRNIHGEAPENGKEVTFKIFKGRTTYEAGDVKPIGMKIDSVAQRGDGAESGRTRSGVIMSGTVVMWDHEKRMGYIRPTESISRFPNSQMNDDGKIFVSQDDVLRPPAVGSQYEFEVVYSARGVGAIHLLPLVLESRATEMPRRDDAMMGQVPLRRGDMGMTGGGGSTFQASPASAWTRSSSSQSYGSFAPQPAASRYEPYMR